MADETVKKGIRVGLRDLHYALLLTDSEEETTYDAPKKIIGAVTAKITPTTDTQKHYSDDALSEIATALGDIGVEFSADDLPLSVQADLLGHTLGTDGVLIENKDDVAPYVALGFRSIKSNSKFRYIWLYKGKFEVPEDDYASKKETTEFKIPVIKGTFMPRESDGAWQAKGDEDETGFNAGTTWFSSVYEKPTP